MAVEYIGDCQLYIVDYMSDISTGPYAWLEGSLVFCFETPTVNYIMQESKTYQTLQQQMQSDWNVSDDTQPTYIANKPSIPAAQIQSNWTETDDTQPDYILNKPTSFSSRTTSALTLSLVGSGTTGTQISSTNDSFVALNVSTSTTASIGSGSTSVVALKICSTNNPTEASWTTVAILENDQSITLAIALQSVQVFKGQLCANVPAGWYCKLVNTGSGTHSEAFISGQQTIYA